MQFNLHSRMQLGVSHF